MLSEERFNRILIELKNKKAVTVTELVNLLNTSESTIRRDLTTLDKMGKLIKVHGGATSVDFDNELVTEEKDFLSKLNLNYDEKRLIAEYAATLIKSKDFVYIDAGTSTDLMIDFINVSDAVYVTNGIDHCKKLHERGCKVYIVGGEVKSSTGAIIGAEVISSLEKYNFTKGFFGTNGISQKCGFTTPDINEGLVKMEAIKRCNRSYVLADTSKFNKIKSFTFADIKDSTIITTHLNNKNIKKITDVIETTKTK